MAIELGKVNVVDLKENDYKIIGVGINGIGDSNIGIFPINYTTLSEAKCSLINLIMTKKGERLMQPEFGCGIYEMLFEPIVTGTAEDKIEKYIVDSVNIWLPYLNIDEIIFDYDENDIDANRIFLDIKFSLKSNRNIGDSVQINVK